MQSYKNLRYDANMGCLYFDKSCRYLTFASKYSIYSHHSKKHI